jgi:streptogramin lyase
VPEYPFATFRRLFTHVSLGETIVHVYLRRNPDMSVTRRFRSVIVTAAVLAVTATISAQSTVAPTNDAPNPYQTIENWAKMPAGRTWGSTSAVEIDRDGKSIWVAERCGANSCLSSNADTVLKFDETGKLVKSFGGGMIIFPHGIHVDRDGNVWVTDGRDNFPTPARGAAAAAPPTAAPAKPIGHQVIKFSPEGKVLMTLGKPGGNRPGATAEPDSFYQPNDVLVAPNGEIWVSEGHGGANARLIKFDKDGKFIKEFGKRGAGPADFDQPHALAMDSRGRLYVGDRSNNRIKILDQEGNLLQEWMQFSRPSGIYIDKQDNIYVADSESESVSRNHNGWKRGIRIGRTSDGVVTAFIPDPVQTAPSTSAAEGVAADAAGVIYGAEVTPGALKRYVLKK